MIQDKDERMAAWAAETRRIGFRRRNWRVVRRLAAVTIILLLASLPAEFVLGSRGLTIACWIGAALAGIIMLVWFFDRRLFVDHLPTPDR